MTSLMNTKQNFNLQGKVALITGGVGILGSAYCKALAEQGAQVIISDLNQGHCEKLAEEINQAHPATAKAFAVDLSSEDSIIQWASSIKNAYGHIDIVINNAAAKPEAFFAPFESYSLKTWREAMAVNVDAIFLILRELHPRLIKQKNASIINVSSIYGLVGPDQRIYEGSWYEDLGSSINTPMIYSATKGAVISMTKYLATYFGPMGIRVNSLVPGGVFSGQNENFQKNYSSRVPMGRMGSVEEMVGAVIFLSSDASSYVNGQNIVVDGGFTAW